MNLMTNRAKIAIQSSNPCIYPADTSSVDVVIPSVSYMHKKTESSVFFSLEQRDIGVMQDAENAPSDYMSDNADSSEGIDIQDGDIADEKGFSLGNSDDNVLPSNMFQCYLCENKYPSISGVRRHLINSHEELEETLIKEIKESVDNGYDCGVCGKIFITRFFLEKHVERKHNIGESGKYVCQYCNKTFSSKECQVRHRVEQHGHKKFHCYFCKRLFLRADTLKRHNAKFHDGGKEYTPCFDCGKLFRCRLSLKKHYDMKHREGYNSEHHCIECGINFQSKRLHERHLYSEMHKNKIERLSGNPA